MHAHGGHLEVGTRRRRPRLRQLESHRKQRAVNLAQNPDPAVNPPDPYRAVPLRLRFGGLENRHGY